MASFDVDGDGVLSDAELEAVTTIDVRGLGIASMKGIEHFTGLLELYCSYNSITELNVSNNPALMSLYCDDNGITALDVTSNPELTDLSCSDNRITELNVSNNMALTELYCDDNDITA